MTDANDITVEPSPMDRFDTAGAMLLACGARSMVSVEQIDYGMLAGMWIANGTVIRYGVFLCRVFISPDRGQCLGHVASWLMATRDELVGAGEVER